MAEALQQSGSPLGDSAAAVLRSASLLFAIHVTDRFALAHLKFAGRELFMSALLPRLAEGSDVAAFRSAYSSFQEHFGHFELLAQPNESPKRTLCWEFAKYAGFAVDRHGDPAALTAATIAANSAVTEIATAMDLLVVKS